MTSFKKPTIVVPMAGNGTRFSDAGYTDIKPLINILGKPMIQRVVDSVGIDGHWVFIVQKDHRERHDIDRILRSIRPNCTIIDTGGGVTEGAACSVLLAAPYIDLDAPLIVINSDNIIEWNTVDFSALDDADGMILCFNDTDPKWSFAAVDEQGFVTRVEEKNPISNIATAGMYLWKTGRQFVHAARVMIARNLRVRGEFYLCPVYNQNIEWGEKIVVRMVKTMWGVGTPEDLNHYIDNHYGIV